jgi:diaminopimelate epimerase
LQLARDRGRAKSDTVRVETDAGVRTVELTKDGARADMGPPALDPAKVPVRLPGPRVIDHPVKVLGETLRITCLSMGNPHAVVYVDDVQRFDVARFGAALERHELFPERVNASFVQVIDHGRARQPRGGAAAADLACGTGACAVCVGRTHQAHGRPPEQAPSGTPPQWEEGRSVFLWARRSDLTGTWGQGGHGV